jgi:hypothetical protein
VTGSRWLIAGGARGGLKPGRSAMSNNIGTHGSRDNVAMPRVAIPAAIYLFLNNTINSLLQHTGREIL